MASIKGTPPENAIHLIATEASNVTVKPNDN
jgi:hypothetical protein